jgi:hypothetical protein
MKKRFEPGRPFAELVEELHAHVSEGRSEKKSHVDKELALVLALPSLLIRALVALQRWLDGWNLLPNALMRTDPMYASMFVGIAHLQTLIEARASLEWNGARTRWRSCWRARTRRTRRERPNQLIGTMKSMLSVTTFAPAWTSILIVMVENGTNTPPVIFTSAKT